MNESRFNKLDDKLDDLKKEVADLKTAVSTGFAVYNKQLEIHIKGTNDNRDEIKLLKMEVEPIKDHVKFIRSLIKLTLTLGGLAGAIMAIVKLLT